jgi:lipopolysaccharide export system protein LptA
VKSRLLVLRRASVILLVLWVAVLVAAFLQRRFKQAPQMEPVESEAPAKEGLGQPVRVHKGFIYSDTLGIEPNFRIAAREAVEFASGLYEFSDVQVSLYHEGRVVYGLVADRLKFDPTSHEAETSGRAEVSLQGGIALRAAGFKFGGKERLLESQGPATFAGPGWGGLAGGVRCSLDKDTLELTDGTSVSWRGSGTGAEPALILLAPRLLYNRNVATIEFNDGLTVLRGRMRVRTAQAGFQLSGPEGELRSATLGGPVYLDGVLDDGSNVDAIAGTTVIESLPEGRYRLTAEPAAETGWVSVKWADRAVGWRDFTAWRLVGEGSRTAWEWLEGQGLACANDLAKGSDPRRLAADRMRLVFDHGQASAVVATEAVRIETGDEWAEGGELQFALATRTFVLRPAAGQRVALGAPGSRSWCDRLEGAEGGDVVARGQVTGTLERAGILGENTRPIRFAAASATASDNGAHLVLEGDARLWQGERLVRADRLEYDRTHDIVTGEGGILTTTRTAATEGKPGEVEIRARKLRYDRPAGVATYEGDVVLDDGQARATCQSLVATLDGNGAVELANLDGGVTVRDRASARVLSGQKARMLVSEGLFEIWGKPVLVKEPGGNQVKADHLEWHRDSNTVVVLGAGDNPSETLYHPHQPSPTPGPRGRKP